MRQYTTKRTVTAAMAMLLVGTLQPLSAATTISAKTLTGMVAVRETAASTTTSTAWVNVPGATATITLPAGTSNVFLARYTAESACYGASGWCTVRILMNGIEMAPAVGTDFAFDSTDSGTETAGSWESHSVERSAIYNTSLFPITVTFQVQYAVTSAAITFRVDDWHFTVQRYQ